MMSFQSLLRDYLEEETPERLGQWFVNRYIKGQWPGLFLEESDVRSMILISAWLENTQYIHSPPQKVQEIKYNGYKSK